MYVDVFVVGCVVHGGCDDRSSCSGRAWRGKWSSIGAWVVVMIREIYRRRIGCRLQCTVSLFCWYEMSLSSGQSS